MNDNNPEDVGLDDNDVRLLALGLMLILVGLAYFFDIVPAAAQYSGQTGQIVQRDGTNWPVLPAQYGGPRMWGFERPEAYEAPPCNPRYNPDCGRFGWEGPRSRSWRYERHPMNDGN